MYESVAMLSLRFLLFLFVVSFELFEELRLGLHNVRPVAATLGTEPLALGLGGEGNTREVKPLYGAQIIITENHLAVRYLVAQTISRLVRIYREIVLRRRWRVLAMLILLITLSRFPLLLFTGGGRRRFLLIPIARARQRRRPSLRHTNHHVHRMRGLYKRLSSRSPGTFRLALRVVRVARVSGIAVRVGLADRFGVLLFFPEICDAQTVKIKIMYRL